MANETFVNRVSGSDFFAVLTPGFYIFLVIYAVVHSFNTSPGESIYLWSVIIDLSLEIQKNPSILIFIFFGAYLFGSIFRAFPVDYAERLIPPFKVAFPYPDKLLQVISNLKEHGKGAKLDSRRLPEFEDTVPMDVYNYWKYVVCMHSKDGFAVYRTFEIRVRFFTGIVWASVVGILGSIIILIQSLRILHPSGGPLLILSVILFLTFGFNLRRVRRHEARALLRLFCAFQQYPPNKEAG